MALDFACQKNHQILKKKDRCIPKSQVGCAKVSLHHDQVRYFRQ
jgi:hypothetical protein